MPCPCNQAKLTAIEHQFDVLKLQQQCFKNIENNVDKMVKNYENCLDKFKCVQMNLSENTINDQLIDNGNIEIYSREMLLEKYNWEEVLKQSKREYQLLDEHCEALKQSMASYQGDCSTCAAQKLEEYYRTYGVM